MRQSLVQRAYPKGKVKLQRKGKRMLLHLTFPKGTRINLKTEADGTVQLILSVPNETPLDNGGLIQVQ